MKNLRCLFCASLLVPFLLAADVHAKPDAGGDPQISVQVDFASYFGTTVTDETGVYYNIDLRAWFAYLYGFDVLRRDYWYRVYEPKVYVPEYWFGNRYDYLSGVPLYFFNYAVDVSVTVTNDGPAAVDLSMHTEGFVLNLDGSSGPSLAPGIDHGSFQLAAGESRTFNASFTPAYAPELDSGLDRFLVTLTSGGGGKVSIDHGRRGNDDAAGNPDNGRRGNDDGLGNTHQNGGGKDSGFVILHEAIFCPPEPVVEDLFLEDVTGG